MKKSLIILALLSITVISYAQRKHHKRQQKIKSAYARHHDNIDDRMKGPAGEAVYIGPNGGRYYLKNGKRVYVQYKGNK